MTKSVSVSLSQHEDFQFDVAFGPNIPTLRTDEPVPLGKGEGPVPGQMLATAVGNCLAASLLFAFRKFKQKPEPVNADVSCVVDRNAEGRMRIVNINARLSIGVDASTLEYAERVLNSFEEYCTVSQSVRQGIPINIEVFDATGARIK